MRYDTRIELVCMDPGRFNPKTCNYEGRSERKTPLYASVMDTRTELVRLVYGCLKQGSLTVQLQNHVDQPFNWMDIGGRRYGVDYRRRLKMKETFIVSQVQT